MAGYGGGISGGGNYGGGGFYTGGGYYGNGPRPYPQYGQVRPSIPGPPPQQQLPSWWLQFIQQGQQMAQQGPEANPYMQNTANVAGQLQNLNNQNITLNPAVQNAINAIRQAQLGAVQQAYTENKTGVLQDLFGRGMGQSTAALDKGNRLGQFLAQARSQAESDAGNRTMQAYQDAYQNRLAGLTGSGNLYNSLAGTNQQAIEDAFRNKLAAMNQTFGFGQQAFDVQNANAQAAYDWQWKRYQDQMQRYQDYMARFPNAGMPPTPQAGGVGGARGGGYYGGGYSGGGRLGY